MSISYNATIQQCYNTTEYRSFHPTAGRSDRLGYRNTLQYTLQYSGSRGLVPANPGWFFQRLESRGPRRRITGAATRSPLQMTPEIQESFVGSLRNVITEFKGSNGQSESGGAEESTSVGESPVGGLPARDTGMEQTLLDGDSQTLGALGRGDVVPADLG